MSHNINEIKKHIKTIFDSGADGIAFVPLNSKGDLQINGFEYNKRYKTKTSPLGDFYHIVLYKANSLGEVIDKDNFTAVLIDPRVYVANLIRSNFYGVVVKQTSGSKKFISDLYKKLVDG